MAKILVSLVSEQTIPNLLLIKEFSNYNKQWFITTEKMENLQKTQSIVNSMKLNENDILKITLEKGKEDDIEYIYQILNSNFKSENKYILNMTGGTKPMMLAAYNFFKEKKCSIYYKNIDKNSIQQIFPIKNEILIKSELTIFEYLTAYNILFDVKTDLVSTSLKELRQILNQYKDYKYDINSLREKYQNDKNYFTGFWFEELCFYTIKEILNKQPKQIATGVKINNFGTYHRSKNDNEFDVMFIENNELFVIEAKVSIGIDKINTINLDNILYKMSALNKNFGIRSNLFLFTLSDFKNVDINFRQDLERKLKVLGIKDIIDRNLFMNKQELNVFVTNLKK